MHLSFLENKAKIKPRFGGLTAAVSFRLNYISLAFYSHLSIGNYD